MLNSERTYDDQTGNKLSKRNIFSTLECTRALKAAEGVRGGGESSSKFVDERLDALSGSISTLADGGCKKQFISYINVSDSHVLI